MFIFHCIVYSFIRPLYCFLRSTGNVLCVVTPVALLTFIQLVLAKGRIRRCHCSHKYLKKATVFMTILSTCFVYVYVHAVWRSSNQMQQNAFISSNSILSSLISSLLLCLLGYIGKNVIYQRVKMDVDVARSAPDLERQPLINDRENTK